MVSGPGAMSGCLVRDDSHCPHNFGVCVDCQVRESPSSFANDDSSGLTSLTDSIVASAGLLSGVSVSFEGKVGRRVQIG